MTDTDEGSKGRYVAPQEQDGLRPCLGVLGEEFSGFEGKRTCLPELKAASCGLQLGRENGLTPRRGGGRASKVLHPGKPWPPVSQVCLASGPSGISPVF